MQHKNVRIAIDGAVHTKRFSWHTACGKEIDDDSNSTNDTSEPVTCGKCLSQHRYLYVEEFAGFGVLIDRNETHTELTDELRASWYSNRENAEAADMLPYNYVIKVFSPFQALGKEIISMVAHLPDDEAALNLAETLIWWRVRLLQGALQIIEWDASVKEPTP